MTTNNNLNLLAYAAPQSKMARARAHGKNGSKEGGLQERKLPLADISNGVTVRGKINNKGKGIYNKELMPYLTSTQCDEENNKLKDVDLNKKYEFIENNNINNINNSINNSDGKDDDDNGDDGEDDEAINREYYKGKENDEYLNNTPRQETRPDLMIPSPLGDMSMNDTSDFTSTSRSDYMDHCGINGLINHTSSNEVRELVEKIIKVHTWPEYKIPDHFDYVYMSEFSKLVLENMHKKFGEVNLESQELWVKIVPMIKNEYQIIRSTVTQSMKNVFLGKYLKYCILLYYIKFFNILIILIIRSTVTYSMKNVFLGK